MADGRLVRLCLECSLILLLLLQGQKFLSHLLCHVVQVESDRWLTQVVILADLDRVKLVLYLTILALIHGAQQLLLGHASRIYFVFAFLQLRSLLHLILNDLLESFVVLDLIYLLLGVL